MTPAKCGRPAGEVPRRPAAIPNRSQLQPIRRPGVRQRVIYRTSLDFPRNRGYVKWVYDTRATKGVKCMTAGNPRIVVRIPPALKREMLEAIKSRNHRTREEPWELSDFVRIAIRDKLHHIQRSRRRRPAGWSGQAAKAKTEG